MTIVNIADLDKAAVLAALHNAADRVHVGIPYFDDETVDEMSLDQAEMFVEIERDITFESIGSRVLAVNLLGDEFNSEVYDQENPGSGGAAAVIERLRETGAISPMEPVGPPQPSTDLSERQQAVVDAYESIDAIIED